MATGRSLMTLLAACLLALVGAAPAHAVATVAADTTRSSSGDPVAAGRSTTLTAGGGLNATQALLRFNVHGIGGPPAHALLRMRVTEATGGAVTVRALPPAFGEDDGTPAQLAPGSTVFPATSGAGSTGTWAEWDVTGAVTGDGDVGLQVSNDSLLDPASFSSREGADAPQLVVTPDDDRGRRLAGLLDPGAAETFVAGVKDDLGSSLDCLDVIAAPPGEGIPGRYIGVHHTLVGGVFITKLVTSDDLTTWTHRADLDTHASQPTLAALPDGGFVLAFERDDSTAGNNLVLRHYLTWAALAAGTSDRTVNLPRSLAPTAEGTPALDIRSWNGPDQSQIAITFHYFRNIDVDRQASGMLTNFSTTGWAPQADVAVNDLFDELGTRGNLGDRANLLYEGHPYSVFEAQSIKGNFGAWRWYLYDRERNEARLLALRARGPAGSYALGNPTVRALPGPTGAPVLLFSGFVFSEGAGSGVAGQFIAVRLASTVVPAGDGAPPATASVVPATSPFVPALRTAPPPPPPPPVDNAAPAARLSGASQKLARTVTVRITCSDEPCRASTTGSVRVKARTYRLAAVATTIATATTATVRLVLSPRARAAIRRALRAGTAVVIVVRAGVADSAGNARTLTRRIRLRL